MPNLIYRSVLHYQQTVGKPRCLLFVVRGHYDRHVSLLLHPPDDIFDDRSIFLVNRCRRLIEKQYLRFDHKSTRDTESLGFAARNGKGILVFLVLKSDKVKNPLYSRPCLLTFDSPDTESISCILVNSSIE